MDDGSSDNSGKILDDYSNKHDNLIVIHQNNQGVSSARNKGIEVSQGKYIWFVDSDDLVVYNILHDICVLLEKHSPDLLFVKPISFEDGVDIPNIKKSKLKEDETTDKYYDWLWTRLIKREILVDSSVRFDTRISFAEDHMFCTRLNPYIQKEEMCNIVAYCYRKRANSLSTSPIKSRLSNLINSASAFWESGQNKIIDYDVAMVEVCIIMCSVMSTIAKFPQKEANEWIKKAKGMKTFPIKKYKKFKPNLQLSGLNIENRILTKLKYKSYTLNGYYNLRFFIKLLKLKRKLFH